MTGKPHSIHRFFRGTYSGQVALVAMAIGLSVGLPACMVDVDSPTEIAGDEENIATLEQSLITDSSMNLALYKATSQSSTAWDGWSSRAVDGNTNGALGAWSVTHTNEEQKPWWQVDLGAIQALGTIVLHNRTDCCGDRLSNFSVLVSNDGVTNWRLAAIHPGSTPSQIRLNLHDRTTGGPIRGRFVRVQLNGTNVLNLAEVQVYAPALVNLAYKKPVWQSSTPLPGGEAWRAVDGKTDGVWGNQSVSHTNNEYQPWWKVDLGSPQAIGGVVLWNRTDCCSNRLSNFRLMLSNDNVTWTTYNYPGGLITSAHFNVNATARYVAIQLNDVGILSLAEVQVLGAPDAERIRSVDLGGSAPGTTKYAEHWGDSRTLDPFLDPADRHFKGNFMGLGRDQILHLNRSGGGAPRAQILDYAGAPAGGVTRYLETWGQSNLLNGWVDDDDYQFVGDFRGLGRDQVMFINRSGIDGKILINDYASGVVPGTIAYLEPWNFSSLLMGWLDNDDRQLVGDFMGLGRDQVMFINRSGSGGKIMINDYVGSAPGHVRYHENWGFSTLLSGWLDNDDLQFVGDFMGLGRSQVMFINRGGAGGKVMIVDFAGGPPGVAKYWESWGQTTQLAGWIDNGDVQLVGDFTGVGRDQLLLFNTHNEGNGKLQVLDYGASWPATMRYFQSWTQTGELSEWPTPGDILHAGKFTTSSRDDLLAHRVGHPRTYTAMGGSPGECPAAQIKVPSGCAPGCPAGQTLLDDTQCGTLVPHTSTALPHGARVVLRTNHRRKREYFSTAYVSYCTLPSCYEPYGPAWIQTNVDPWGYTIISANTTTVSPRVFTVEASQDADFPHAFFLRTADKSYISRSVQSQRKLLMGDASVQQYLGLSSDSPGTLSLMMTVNDSRTIFFADYEGEMNATNVSWIPGDYRQPIEVFLVE